MTTKGPSILAASGRLALALLIILSTGAGAAADQSDRAYNPFKSPEEKSEFISFSIERWYSLGRDLYQTRQQLAPSLIMPLENGVYTGSTWDFQRSDASINLYAMEIKPWKPVSFDVRYAGGYTRAGNVTEHDFAQNIAGGPWTYLPTGQLFLDDQFEFGRADIEQSGSTSWLTTSIYIHAFSTDCDFGADFKCHQNLDVFVGYDRYSMQYNMGQWNQIVSSSYLLPEQPPGIVGGNNSNLSMLWQGFRPGVRETVSTDFGLKVNVVLAYSPLQSYTASGFNALQSAAGNLSPTSPNFKQRADGSLFDGVIGASYSPIKLVSLDAGWMYLYLWSNNGREKDFLPSGLSMDQEINKIRSQRFGWYTGASLHF